MKARKIIICVLATLSLSSLAFAQKSGRYVNSREGLNIRAEPNAGAEKVGALKYGEFVEVAGEGEKASIDGIEARWTKTAGCMSKTSPQNAISSCWGLWFIFEC